MQKVLTAEEMRHVDRLTTERYGIPSLLLMENAAHAAARLIYKKMGGSVEGRSVLVLCGKGNNGGDGSALARILWTNGARCTVLLFGTVAETKGDANVNFDACRRLAQTAPPQTLTFAEDAGILPDLTDFDVLVDALLGTGVDRPITGRLSDVIDGINNTRQRGSTLVVSLDLPSGLASDDAEPIGPCVSADIVVTFTAPKPANVLSPAYRSNGELHVANIGSPAELLASSVSELYLATAADVTGWFEKTEFSAASYKNKRGHALMIAGSRNYTGAAVLCGDAAIRSGVGLVTLAVPESSRESVIARVVPEVMVRGISETETGSADQKAVEEINAFLKNVDVVAVGSGLSSKERETRELVAEIVGSRRTPVIIDADGLTALSPFEINGSDDLPLILTPHEGEFMRLLGTQDKSVIKDRVAAVREFAVKHHVILVLKGERGLIGSPDGRVVVNPTGNSGLGKAGNGDTLTGIITGFVGQAVQMKVDMFETVVAAVYLAGMAGDIAVQKYGKRVMTASDVRECLVDVFERLGGK